MTKPPPIHLAPRLALAACLAWPAASRAADERCEVLLAPGASEAWEEAARGVRQRLASAPDGARDCREIRVILRPDAPATLLFTTRDGRVTERTLETPEELAPLVDALVVTMPPPPPAAAAPPAAAPRAAEPPAARLVGAIGLGGTLSGTDPGPGLRYASPVVALGAWGLLGGWDLGALATWTTAHRDLQTPEPDGFVMTSFSLGIELNRRVPAGPVALRYGASLARAQIHQEYAGATPPRLHAADEGQVRAGLHIGAVFPRNTAVRLLVDLRGEAALFKVEDAVSIGPGEHLPMPRYGLTLTLGAEAKVL